MEKYVNALTWQNRTGLQKCRNRNLKRKLLYLLNFVFFIVVFQIILPTKFKQTIAYCYYYYYYFHHNAHDFSRSFTIFLSFFLGCLLLIKFIVYAMLSKNNAYNKEVRPDLDHWDNFHDMLHNCYVNNKRCSYQIYSILCNRQDRQNVCNFV